VPSSVGASTAFACRHEREGHEFTQDYSLDKSNGEADSEADEELERGPMPLMPKYFQQSLVFIYPNESSAKTDEGFLGAGFIVGHKSPTHPSFHFHYIVTAYHVLKDYSRTSLRMNVVSAGVHTITNVPLRAWTINKKIDLAVLPIRLTGFDFSFVSVGKFMDAEKMKRHDIGAGDEVCLVGRIVRDKVHYLKRNVSVLRFGNIALIPQHEETMFMVELRSIAGHSGSPVMVYCLPYDLSGSRTREQMWGGYILLGLNRGHLREFEQIVSKRDLKTESKHWVSQTNMAMSQIVPAWHIAAMLDSPKLVRERERRMLILSITSQISRRMRLSSG
jgi:hypothetical protein